MGKNKSIRLKLVALVITLLIPLTALIASNIIKSYNEEIDSRLDNFKNLAGAISTAFINYLEEIWIMEDIVGTYISDHPYLSGDDASEYLNLVLKKQTGISCISWLDAQGGIIYSTDARLIGKSLYDREYFKRMLNGSARGISDLLTRIVDPYQNIVSVAHGIYKEGALAGAVTAIIDLENLQQRLPDFAKHRQNFYMLIDSKGTLVYRSDLKKIPEDTISCADSESVSRALKGELVSSTKVSSMTDASPVMCVDYPIPEIGWVCRVFTPYKEAMMPHNRELITSIAVLLFLFFISLVLALILGNFLLKPVSILTAAAKKIMEGDYSVRTNIKRDDEIGLAAEAFDKMAESIEHWRDVKSQFYTNLSHELKTPLNVIFSSVQLIDNYKVTLDAEHYQLKVPKQMKLIRQNCYRIMRLINNFIDISRYDSGFLKIKPGRYDIVKIVREITLSVQRYAEAKGIILCFVSDLKTRTMACDPDMLERIMLNLISNAIKFTGRNGAITVRLEDEEGCLILSVIDNGMGIPQDKINFIFERYRQADNSLMLNRDGSGIGLSLVKALVEAHGGTITVKSELQKGTTFQIRFPASSDADSSNLEEVLLDPGRPVSAPAGAISRINIEFSDIYSCSDEEIS